MSSLRRGTHAYAHHMSCTLLVLCTDTPPFWVFPEKEEKETLCLSSRPIERGIRPTSLQHFVVVAAVLACVPLEQPSLGPLGQQQLEKQQHGMA